MLLAVWFFTGEFYYKNILDKPHPTAVREKELARQREQRQEADTATTEEEEEQAPPPPDTSMAARADTIPQDTTRLPEEAAEVAQADTVWVETETLIIGISERGGRIVSARTKKYLYDSTDVSKAGEKVELVDAGIRGGANLSINEQSLDDKLFEADVSGTVMVEEGQSRTVSFVYDGLDYPIRKEFVFTAKGYEVGLRVQSPRLDGKKVGVGWEAGIRESEGGEDDRSSRYDVRKVHLYDGSDVEHYSTKKAEGEERTGFYKWVGLTSKYFLVALVADTVTDADIRIATYREEKAPGEEQGKDGKGEINYRYTVSRFAGGTRQSYRLYIGPAQLTALKDAGSNLHKVLFGGWKFFFRADKWFPLLCEFVLWLLVSLHGIVKDYGIVILILTFLSKVVTFPLTQSSLRSMNRMKELQPKINAVREKHKNNPKKMNEKLMAMYKEEGVSPLQMGCLPMLLQMPIFISLFVVLRKAIELRGAETILVPWVNDLSKAEELFRIPDLPLIGGLYGNNFALLPVVMAVLTFFQQKATVKDPNQKAMVYIMPVFMLVIFNSFPAGLVLYWTFSSALQLVQQSFIDKRKAAIGGGGSR
jgi:YidC/Oxa1 family membrane protein insertase